MPREGGTGGGVGGGISNTTTMNGSLLNLGCMGRLLRHKPITTNHSIICFSNIFVKGKIKIHILVVSNSKNEK